MGLVMNRLGLKLDPEEMRMVDLRRGRKALCFWAARFQRSGAYRGTRARDLCSVAVTQGNEANPGTRTRTDRFAALKLCSGDGNYFGAGNARGKFNQLDTRRKLQQ